MPVAQESIWQAVLGELEVTVSKAHFQTWLKRTTLASVSETVAVLSVPDIFVRSWVESHYRHQLLTSFQKHIPTLSEVRIEILGSPPAQVNESFDDATVSTESSSNSASMAAFEPKPISKASSVPLTIVSHQTFTTFVEGNNNRLASAVSRAVAKSPGTLYNPLFIYGGVGLGKTHLMHAIANEVMAHDSKKRVLYVSCEKFTNDYIEAIRSKHMDRFKDTYRTLDLLLVDDIQFIANKEGSQEEFFNTFNTLHQSNRQIVIAADRIPKAIPGLEERLSSRFGWGMIVDIQPPNLETRMAILKTKASEKHVTFPEDALEYIASQIQSNIRELEGALNRVIIYAETNHVPYSLESCRSALSGLITPTYSRQTYSVDTVYSLIAEYFGINVADLLGKKRQKELVYPRHLTMYILKEELNMSFSEIGREMGGKDHTTIMHGYNKIAVEVSTLPRVTDDMVHIKQRLVNL